MIIAQPSPPPKCTDPASNQVAQEHLVYAAIDGARKRQEAKLRAFFRNCTTAELDSEAEYLTRELAEIPDRQSAGDLDEAGALLITRGLEYDLEILTAELARRSRISRPYAHAERRFDTGFVRDLKNRLDLPLFIAEYQGVGRLRRESTRFVGLCPFHAEMTPSFTVYDGERGWYCFGCGRGGDVFTFLEETGLTFSEAVRAVAGYLGVAVPINREALPVWERYSA
jgi:hypothetical protein